MPMAEDLVSVYRTLDEATANIVKAALEDAGIPAVVQGRQSSWFDGLFVPAEGSWGDVLVRSEDAERATALLRDYAEAEGNSEQEADA